MTASSNFAALATVNARLAELGREAERLFADTPRAAMGSLRLWGETLAIELVELHGLPTYAEQQLDRLRRLGSQTSIAPDVLDQLHVLRKEGNKAVHVYGEAGHREAMRMLRAAAALTRWFWQTHSTQPPPPPGPFVKPESQDPRAEQALLRAQLEAERREREASRSELDDLLRLLEMPQVATYQEVEGSFQNLRESDQQRVSEFLKRFREEPIHEAWPLERPEGMVDDKVRVITLDHLAVVVVRPPRADVLIVAHVGPLEEALAWAAGRRFEVHPTVGTLQVYDIQEAEAAAPAGVGALFDHVSDADLQQVGLPAPLLPAVRGLDSEGALDALSPHLPPEASDGLYLLAAGYSLEQALRELERTSDDTRPVDVDADDFAAALHHPDSRRSFLLLEEDADLEAVLSGSVEAWRLYLHPDQQKLVRMNAKGPIRVLGGAGTGKTVALMHRARFLVEEVWTAPDQRILVTTFTRNLAADLAHHLARLLSPDDFARVEVVNVHALAARLWAEHGDGRRIALDRDQQRAWEVAMVEERAGRPRSFYEDEWAQVVQAQDIEGEVAYLRARRTGRGRGLSRQDRRQIWAVLDAYRSDLDEHDQVEAADAMRLLRRAYDDGRLARPFVSALVDEVQDLDAAGLRFLRGLIPPGPHDLFLVGDSHQRIYGAPVVMGRCGIEIRGRARRLKVNYRTTAKVRGWAEAALKGLEFDDMDGGSDSLSGGRSLRLGVEPQVRHYASRAEEHGAILRVVEAWLETGPPENICVAAPTNSLVQALRAWLEDNDVPVTVLDSEAVSVGEGVRLATFHRLKGLEFPRVLLSGVEDGLMPLRIRAFEQLDDDAKARWDQRQRCLLYVAATRARDELVVTGGAAWTERP